MSFALLVFALILGCMFGVSWDRGLFWWTISSALLGAVVLFALIWCGPEGDDEEEETDGKTP